MVIWPNMAVLAKSCQDPQTLQRYQSLFWWPFWQIMWFLQITLMAPLAKQSCKYLTDETVKVHLSDQCIEKGQLFIHQVGIKSAHLVVLHNITIELVPTV